MTVEYFMNYLRPFYPTWDEQAAAELIRQFELPRGRKLRHLSHGMRMKAAMASALAFRPELIVLDEPFTGLDPLVRDELIEGLLPRAENTTVFISSHDLSEIESFASHIGFLDHGRLRFSEEMTSLSARFREIEVTLELPALRLAAFPAGVAERAACRLGVPLRRFAIRRGAQHRGGAAAVRGCGPGGGQPYAPAGDFRNAGEGQPKGGGMMRQALHIFRKDVRYLWIEIAAVLLATALFMFTDARSAWNWRSPLPRTVAAFLVNFLLPFAWWTVIVRAVHAETLTGDRQFWPTRPYSWRSLLAAKALLHRALREPADADRSGDCRQGAWIPGDGGVAGPAVDPGAADRRVHPAGRRHCRDHREHDAVPRNRAGRLHAALLLSMGFMRFASALTGGAWGPIEWTRSYYMLLLAAIAASAVLIWQYARRRTWAVRALAITAAVVIAAGAPFSWPAAFRAAIAPLAPSGGSLGAARGIPSKIPVGRAHAGEAGRPRLGAHPARGYGSARRSSGENRRVDPGDRGAGRARAGAPTPSRA